MRRILFLLLTLLTACVANITNTFETTHNGQIQTIYDRDEVPTNQRFDLTLTFLNDFGLSETGPNEDHAELTFSPVSADPCLYFKIWDQSVQLKLVSESNTSWSWMKSSLSESISSKTRGVRFWIDWSGDGVKVGTGDDDELVGVSFEEISCRVDRICGAQRGIGTVRWEVNKQAAAICRATNHEALDIKTTIPNRWKVEGQTTQVVYVGTKADMTCGSDAGLRLYVNLHEIVGGNDCGYVLQECSASTSNATGSGTLCHFQCPCVNEASCQYLYLTEARPLP